LFPSAATGGHEIQQGGKFGSVRIGRGHERDRRAQWADKNIRRSA
jgi:hypothetical protein